MSFKRKELFDKLTAVMIEDGKDIKDTQGVVDMTEAAIGSALSSFTYFFKNNSLEDRMKAISLMMDIIKSVAKVAVDHLMTHDEKSHEKSHEETHH